MIEYNILQITPYAEFNWAFTTIVALFPALFTIKAVIRIFTRS